MLSSSILDVAIGMVFIYLLLSLIASTVQEFIAAVVQARAANLEHGIRSLFSGGELGGKSFVELIYTHGVIRGLYKDCVQDCPGTPAPKVKTRPLATAIRWLLRINPPAKIKGVHDTHLLPAYIPARTFALTIIDILNTGNDKRLPPLHYIEHRLMVLRDGRKRLDTDPPGVVDVLPSKTSKCAAQALLALLADAKTAEDAADKFRCNLENWYNDAMDRVSGWYKKYTQKILLVIGLTLAVVFNVDSIRVARTLWFDKDARSGLASAAGSYIQNNAAPVAASAPAGTPVVQSPAPVGLANADHAKADPVPADQPKGRPADAKQPVDAQASAKCKGGSSVPGSPLCEDELASRMETTVKAFNKVSLDYLLPIGWSSHNADYNPNLLVRIPEQLAGWLVTAFALSLGAPFWFDLLNKFMVVRNTVKPQEKSKNESSKDG